MVEGQGSEFWIAAETTVEWTVEQRNAQDNST